MSNSRACQPVSVTKRTNKLECLFLASLSSPVLYLGIRFEPTPSESPFGHSPVGRESLRSVSDEKAKVKHLRCSTRADAPDLSHTHQARQERPARDKHSSLLRTLVDYGSKKYNDADTCPPQKAVKRWTQRSSSVGNEKTHDCWKGHDPDDKTWENEEHKVQ